MKNSNYRTVNTLNCERKPKHKVNSNTCSKLNLLTLLRELIKYVSNTKLGNVFKTISYTFSRLSYETFPGRTMCTQKTDLVRFSGSFSGLILGLAKRFQDIFRIKNSLLGIYLYLHFANTQRTHCKTRSDVFILLKSDFCESNFITPGGASFAKIARLESFCVIFGLKKWRNLSNFQEKWK